MSECTEHEIMANNLPYDLEEPEDEHDITRGLMRLSSQVLSRYLDQAPDNY
jgi:hypothetical protein